MSEKSPWYSNKGMVYFLVIIFFPVGLYGLWKNDEISKNIKIGISAAITIFILIGIFSDDTTNTTKQTTNDTTTKVEEKETEKIYKINEKIKDSEFEIKVSSVRTAKVVGNQYFNEKAPQGAVFVLVQFNYKNITKKPISSSSTPDINLIDPNGNKYDEHAGATIYYQTQAKINKKILSDINPMIRQRDATVFEVALELWKQKNWQLLIDADDDYKVKIK